MAYAAGPVAVPPPSGYAGGVGGGGGGGGGVCEITEEDVVNGVVLGPDGFVYRPPPQSQQLRIDMQVTVTSCETWQEVLGVVDRDGDLFDFRNTSTAVHRVARYGQDEGPAVLAHPVFPRLVLLLRAKCKDLTARALSDAAWGLAKLQCRDEGAWSRLETRAKQLAGELDPQGLALTAWAFATVGRRDEELFQLIAAESQRRMGGFGPQNIANLIWANATLGFRCDPLHTAIVAAAVQHLEDFSAQNLAMVNWALTKLAFEPGQAWRTEYRRKMLQLKEYAPSELSMMAWALATRGEYDPDFMAYIARRSMELMRSFTGQHVATLIWAMATVSYKDDPCIDEFLGMALGAIIGRANEFQPLNLALISWGLAKMSYRAEAAFDALCAAATAQMDNFVPQNLVQILWACATCGYRDDAFLRAAGRVARARLREFSSQHLSNFIWACARLAYKDDAALFRDFCAVSIARMHEGTPQHLSNIAWAVSQLGPELFPGCLDSVVAETARRLAEFDSPSLMMLSDSLFDAKYAAGQHQPMLNVVRSRIMQMGDELLRVFTEGLPPRRTLASPGQVAEYQQRLRGTGLVTFGYEHTHSLFDQLRLSDGQRWDPAEASAIPGWTTNARRSTCARRHDLRVGSTMLQDPGSVFTSAFSSSTEDAECDFIVAWLGHGKADAPTTGRASRSGDAECRAIMDTHMLICRAKQELGFDDVRGAVTLHTSGVPCLSCVGVAAQFKRCYPNVAVCFTFAPREHGWDAGPEVAAAAPHGQRFSQQRAFPAGGDPDGGGGGSYPGGICAPGRPIAYEQMRPAAYTGAALDQAPLASSPVGGDPDGGGGAGYPGVMGAPGRPIAYEQMRPTGYPGAASDQGPAASHQQYY